MILSLRKRSMKPRRGSAMAGLKAMIPMMGCHQSYCSVHMPGAIPTSNCMEGAAMEAQEYLMCTKSSVLGKACSLWSITYHCT